MTTRKLIIYGGVILLSLTTIFAVIANTGSFKAFDDGLDSLKEPGSSIGTSCGYTTTAIKVMNDWQKNGILNICQQEVFINKADDALYSYSQNPSNLENLTAFMTAVDSVLNNPSYLAAAKAKDYPEMRRIEREAYMPLFPRLEGIISEFVQAFKDSGGKKLVQNRLHEFLGVESVSARTPCDDFQKFERDCWKPLKWPKGWETGPSSIGLPGWGGIRNPKDLPGWEFGGGPFPGGGDAGIIMPPGNGGWGIGIGTGGGGWIGVGGGNRNGGGFIGLGSGGVIIIGGGIRF